MPKEITEAEVEEVLARLRVSLKGRGAEGIRGLARHFRIVDRDHSGKLDRDEFSRLCTLNKLGLDASHVATLWRAFDRDGSGEVCYEEFLGAARGRLPPVRRNLVTQVFKVLDSVNPDGVLTVEDIEKAYSTSQHPEVIAGRMTRKQALQELLDGMEGSQGNRDGRVTLDEWIKHYEEVSVSIDEDDYFGQMIATTWRHLSTRAPDGSKIRAIQYVPRADVDRLEEEIKKSIYSKKAVTNSQRVVEKAFRVLDKDKSGSVSLDEFIGAMEGFGMQVQGLRPGAGGLPLATVKALFNSYDADHSGSITYAEFCGKLFAEPPAPEKKQFYPPSPKGKGMLVGKTADLPPPTDGSKPCFAENRWLKGSNHVVGT